MSFIGLVAVGVVLAVSIAALLTVALLGVGTQAMRAARPDPATSLRDE